MKKRVGLTVGILLAVLILSAVFVGISYSRQAVGFLNRAGWENDEQGQWFYLDYWGRPLSGWQEIDGKTYYFSIDTGEMATGWLMLEDAVYYLDENGNPTTGWQRINGKDYYLQPDGTLAVGWQEIEGITCYLGENGAKRTGWQEIDGKHYFFHSDGEVAVGWVYILGKRHYFLEDGSACSGWVEHAGGRYYLDNSGQVQTGWVDTDDGRYYLGYDGKEQTGWIKVDGKSYYLSDSGVLDPGWYLFDGTYYRIDDCGALVTGDAAALAADQDFPIDERCAIVLSKDNPVPEDWEVFPVLFEDDWSIDVRCYTELLQMLADCRAEGIKCGINSAYRSTQEQQEIWDNRVISYQKAGMTEEAAVKKVRREVATPGYSEHQLGFAVDIDGFQAHAWMAKNSWRYGFIQRYPQNKQAVTGTIYEPWHFRFVGKELAKELYESGLCMEEYFGQ